jgi:pyridoxamine 5'-phosphate oxidase
MMRMSDTYTVAPDPFSAFESWFAEAKRVELNDPNAMTLATATKRGRPSARIVLLKSVDREGFVFYSNTKSRKGHELATNGYAALLFHWKTLGRQVRIEGKVGPVHPREADAYFDTRPRISQLGAWASDQSRPLADRQELQNRLVETGTRYEGHDIPRPSHWSGYRVRPDRFEFWQDMPFRLHDRTVYTADGGSWRLSKLFP